ncbi:MAG: excinuclease ABC subunit UvrC [bacterium]
MSARKLPASPALRKSSASSAPLFDATRFLASLRARPGVYVFYQADGAALYVGKAVNLKSRVSSYFRAGALSPKTRLMVSKIARAEVQQTRTDSEALLLENNLIKDKRPRYNISLRDDKSFPYIRLSARAQFPRFTFYRGRRARADQYYGPYPSAGAVREMLAQLHKIFRLRQCNDAFFRNRTRPCLQYQIKRCSAPCVGRIARDDYLEDVRQAKEMLGGRDFALIDELADKMERASTALDYETAARFRDRIALLQRARAGQYVAAGQSDADIVAVALEGDAACFAVVSIRHGRNLGVRFHIRRNPLDLSGAELLQAFLPQHYLGAAAAPCPPEILLSEKITGIVALRDALAQESPPTHSSPKDARGANKMRKLRKIEIKHRCRAHRARWIESARINAADHLRGHLAQHSQVAAQQRALAKMLSLAETPARIECFDISHTLGERAVGACVVFDRDGAVKSDYRKFNLADIAAGDDYAALEQTLMRRYKRVLAADGKMPDLIIVDGGKGQLRVAARVCEELQMLDSVALLGVSKGPARRAGEERLHLFGRTRAIQPGKRGGERGGKNDDKNDGKRNDKDDDQGSDHDGDNAAAALRLIQRIRDEAHRFAIGAHRQRRAKARTESPLQRIAGVGEKRRRSLLRYFGGMREVARAGVEDLAKAPGISPKLAQRIYDQLH